MHGVRLLQLTYLPCTCPAPPPPPPPPATPRSLNLKQCKRVGDGGLAALAPRLQRLTALCLQGASEVSDAGVAHLAQLRGLEELELQFAWQFSDAGIAALAQLSALSRLDLMYRWVGPGRR